MSKQKHNYDEIRLKKLLGININTKKQKTFYDLQQILIADFKEKSKFVNYTGNTRRCQLFPNVIILLKKCGFDFNINNDSKKNIHCCLYYDEKIICDIQYPIQIYYTNKIFEQMAENKYFRNNYMNHDFLDDDYICIEKDVENKYSEYGNKKFLDIAIKSKYNGNGNSDKIIMLEINEYAHNSKQTEDEKRSDDLKYRKNKENKLFFGPFVLRLNKEGKIAESEIKRMSKDVLELVQIIDNCADKKQYTINYMVENKIGNFEFCEMMYESYENKNTCSVPFNDILVLFGSQLKVKKEKIKQHFIDYRKDYLYRLAEETKNKNMMLFDDSDLDLDLDLEQVPEDKKQDLNFETKHNDIYLNFDGISDVFQYLLLHEEYFKHLQEHHRITKFFDSCVKTMMHAINELYEMQEKMIVLNKKNLFYGSYN